jgi:hypothetical protein
MRVSVAGFLVWTALCGCGDSTAPVATCDVFPLQEGNRWSWAIPPYGFFSDTVQAPVVMNSHEYFPMRASSLGLFAPVLLRMDGACRLLILDGEDEKVFIDFNAPVLEPWSLQMSLPGGGFLLYEVQIRSKRGFASFPGGKTENGYIVDIATDFITDNNSSLLIAPGVGVVRLRGGFYELSLVDFHLNGAHGED